MAQNNINQNGNFHTPLSPMRFQSSMGKEVKRKYKDGKNMVRLSLARVTKVNYKYNTVDVVTIQDKNDTTKNPNDNGRFSARLPVQFGGQTPDGKVFGTNTLVTVGCLVLVGFLEGHKDNPIVLNIYGDVDNQSMLTRTTFTGADESDEALQAELWQLFTLYPSMTYKNIDGHGNQEVTFPGKTFFFSSEDSRVNDAFFDYDHLPSSSYANGDLIEPTVPEAPNMLYVHQSLVDNHRVTLFVKSDGTVRVGSRHNDGQGVTFWQLNTDGSFKIQQSNDTVDPEDQSSNFSSFSIEEDGTIALQSGDNLLTIGSNGLSFNGGAINGGSLDLSNNETIKTIQGDIATLQQTTTTDGIITTVTDSTPWHDINQQVGSKATTFIATPAPPYNIGDIWENGGKVYVCTVPKAIGATFAQSDWTLSGDVTSQNTAADTTNVNGTPASNITSGISSAQSTATTAQTTAQAKSEMFLSQPTPPYNKGDVWNNNGVMYVSNITRPDGATFLMADWTKAADVTANNTSADTANVNGTPASSITSGISSAQSAASSAQSTANSASSAASTAQSTADGKARTFTATPVPPYSLGDMWNQSGKVYSCITPKSSTGAFNAMDWVLVADMTSQNTAADTTNVNGQASSTLTATVASNTSAASNAQSTANSAQSLATSKAKAFITQPVTPYSVGDVWDNGSTVYICQTARSTGAFVMADWKLAGDVTANNTAADTSAVNGTSSSTVISNISTAQSTANSANSLATSKAKGFITQPVPPYSVGDVWDNNGTVYICSTARSTGSFTQSDWQLSGDVTSNNTAKDTAAVNGQSSSTLTSTVSSNTTAASNAQTTANSKAKTFTSQPTLPYNLGDIYKNGQTVYVCTTARSTGSYTASDWTLVGDVTSQNTANDTTNVNGQSSSTLTSTVSSNTTAASNAQSAASSAQSTANSAQSLAQSKAEGFVSQPVPPYSVGDVWNNNGTVYICHTAKASGNIFSAADWVLAGDVTANNTANDTSKVNGQSASTLTATVSSNTTAASNAQSAANTAQSTANSKAKGFVAQPTTPYSAGDIWNNNGTVYICTTARSTGSFTQSDWTLSGDVTANNTAADTANVNGQSASTLTSTVSSNTTAANNAQTTANSKAKGFTSQPTIPYNAGDVWNNSGTVYICTTARATGVFTQSDWTLAGDVTSNNTAKDTAAVNGTTSSTVISNISTAQSTANTANTNAGNAQTAANNAQTTANSKAQGFTTQPTIPYNAGDVWNNGGTVYICTTTRSTGSYTASDWTLAGDVTSNNTAKDTSAVNGTASSTVISNISSASSAASSAQSTANSAQSAASTAQTTANSKAQTFTSTPVPPYSVGDIYKNGSTIYVCTTAKASGNLYSAADFTLVGDVTANNTAADTSAVNGTASSTVIGNISSANTAATNAQTTANSKAKTFTSQPTTPYSTGDIYRNGSTIYVCTTARASGSYTGSDWTLVGDVTANNTASDTAHVNGQVASTLTSTVSSNTTAASNAQSTANSANTAATNAQTTANSKAQTFTTTPAPPYNVGDIYKNGSTVYVCTTAKTSGGTYVASDFTLVGDVTANNTSADTSAVNGTSSSTVISNISSASSAASTAQTTANSKAKTFTATPTVPYNVGDIYQTTNAVYICTTARPTGSYTAGDWYKAGDVTSANTAADTSAVNGTASSTVISNISSANTAATNAQSTANSANTAATNAQTTANSKAQTFTATPTIPYSLGDIYRNGSTIYVCTTARASGSYTAGDWTLVGDVTANNTAADTAHVNGTVASTVTSNITTAQNTANSAQTTANSKSKTFTSTPTAPYNIGDLYQTGGKVYVATVAETTTYNAGDWVLAGDVTSQNTASDTANVNGVASATVNSNISSANTAATNAQTTANSKAKTFTAQPTTPYNLGDIYQTTNAVYICTTARASGGYVAGDWYKAGDVTSANTANDTSNVNGVASATVNSNISSASSAASAAQTTANSKAKTYTSQPAPPYNTGDVWQTTNAVYICTAGRASGSYTAADWYKAGDVTSANTSADTSAVNGVASATVNSNISSASSAASAAQTTANSKAKTYTAQPAPPYNTGDVWQTTNAVYICTAGRASGSYTASDWYKAGDVTSANTAADTTNVNGTASATVISNISSANSAASAAQTTANGKAKVYTSQPAPPYNVGDIWQNSGSVYVCTAARASGSYTASDWYKAGDVTSQNTAADVTNVNGTPASTVISNISTAQSTANNAQTAVNNLQVGGRNLIYGQGWGSNPTANWDSTGYYVEVHLNTVLQPNTTYTFSYQYSVLKGTEANLFVGIGGGNSGQYNMDYIAWANTPITQKVFTFTTPSTLSYPYFQWRPWINKPNDGTEVSVNFWNIKLEKGNKATDWTPAPEDVQAYTDLASIGGRNYLRNTSNFPDLTNWGLNVGSGVTVTQNISSDATYGAVVDTYVSANGTTNNWIVIQNVGLTLPGGKFTVGNTYTVSFLMKNDLAMLVSFCDTNGTNGVAPASPTIPVSASWQRIVYTFTASATGNTPEFYLSANDTTHTGHILVTQLQLEDGTKATGYNPAPEDVNNQISTVASNVNNVMQGVFPSTMGSQIVNTVTSASTYVSALNAKADASDLANYATGDQLTQAQQAANSYTDQSIQGIDFSPYATTASLTQTSNQLTAQFTSSGGVNLLLNSVGHAVDITTKLPSFWNVVSGTPGVTSNPTLSQFGASSGLTLSGSTINQQVTVTPNVTYTLSAIVYKGTAGTGYIKVTDTSATPIKAETDFASGTAYTYKKISMNITPATSTLTVEISGDATSGGVIFTCVMLNVGSTAFTWQQAPGEVYNTNVNFDLNGIRVMATDSNNKATSETIMTPTKFAGYSDLNGDGVIDTSTGSVDEVFRMDKDTFVMKNATIGPIKIVAVTGTHTGFAFVPNS